MKFFISILLTAALAYALCLFLPWWSVAIAAIVVGIFISQKPALAWLSGFLGIFLLWFVQSHWISSANDHLLAHRISELIIKNDSPFLLFIVTGLIGGLVGGFAAASGSWFRRAFQS